MLTISQKMAFFACGVCNAIVKTNGDDNAKSPPHVGSRGRWEHRMALAAAVSRLAAENHGGEFGVHGDAIFYFYFVFVIFFRSLSDFYSTYLPMYGSIEGSTG